MHVSCNQYLFEPSHQMQDPFTDIEWKQATCSLHKDSRYMSGHQNTASRAGTREKRLHCNIPALSFVVRFSRVAVSLHAALSREAEGHRVDRPCCSKRRLTVRAETARSTSMHIFWLMGRDVVIRICRAELTICLSTWALVMEMQAVLHDTQQSTDSIFAWQWMDVDQFDGRYHGTIIHTLDREQSCLYRIPTLIDMHFFLLFKA